MNNVLIKIIVVLTVILLIEGVVLAVVRADTNAICVVHKGEWVWIRDQPSKDGSKIDTIRYGTECQISQIVNQYAHITSDYHESGWVDIFYLEIPINETVYTIESDGPLNVREMPDGRYLRRIKSGSRVSVLGWRYSKAGELWAKVFKGGYVKASYLAEVYK